MQFKTQPWREGGILRGCSRIPHHTRKGARWWGRAQELCCDVMLAPYAFFVPFFFWPLGPFRSAAPWNNTTYAHMLSHFTTHVLILVGITHATLKRILHNEVVHPVRCRKRVDMRRICYGMLRVDFQQ
jgi:hypothetical protein